MRFYDEDRVSQSAKNLCLCGSGEELAVKLAVMGSRFSATDFVYMAANVNDGGVARAVADEVLNGSAFDDALCEDPYFDVDYYLAASMDKKATDPDQYVKFPVLDMGAAVAMIHGSGNQAVIYDAATRKMAKFFGQGVRSVSSFRKTYVEPALARKEYKR